MTAAGRSLQTPLHTAAQRAEEAIEELPYGSTAGTRLMHKDPSRDGWHLQQDCGRLHTNTPDSTHLPISQTIGRLCTSCLDTTTPAGQRLNTLVHLYHVLDRIRTTPDHISRWERIGRPLQPACNSHSDAAIHKLLYMLRHIEALTTWNDQQHDNNDSTISRHTSSTAADLISILEPFRTQLTLDWHHLLTVKHRTSLLPMTQQQLPLQHRQQWVDDLQQLAQRDVTDPGQMLVATRKLLRHNLGTGSWQHVTDTTETNLRNTDLPTHDIHVAATWYLPTLIRRLRQAAEHNPQQQLRHRTIVLDTPARQLDPLWWPLLTCAPLPMLLHHAAYLSVPAAMADILMAADDDHLMVLDLGWTDQLLDGHDTPTQNHILQTATRNLRYDTDWEVHHLTGQLQACAAALTN